MTEAVAQAEGSEAPGLPLPEIIVRGSYVRVDQVQAAPAQVVPVLTVRSIHVEVQLPLQDPTIDKLIEALSEIRRARRGLAIASELPTGPSDRLPGRARSHP